MSRDRAFVPNDRRAYVGILNLDKPRGLTSHDAVDRVRRATGMRRVGHAGTLDPEATGVLLVLLGSATRVSDLLMESTKRYRAVVRFGATSTTDDAAGEITVRAANVQPDEAALRAAMERFIGEIDQVPPAYAAIKVGGRPMYERARRGQAVVAAPRRIRIDQIDVVAQDGSDLTIDVTCSKGTYIRALARDLGEALGMGAYLASLVRTASGDFCLADAVSLDDVANAARDGDLNRLLSPIDVAARHLPARYLYPDDVRRLRHGQSVAGPDAPEGTLARGYDLDRGELVALLRSTGAAAWRPDVVFSVAEEG